MSAALLSACGGGGGDGFGGVACPSDTKPYVFVTYLDGSISVFEVNEASGALTFLRNVSAVGDGQITDIAFSECGTEMYVSDFDGQELQVFSVAPDATFTVVDTETFSGNPIPYTIVLHPLLDVLYLKTRNDDKIYQYEVATDGSLSPLTPPSVSTIDGANSPQSIAVDPFGQFLYAAGVTPDDAIAQFAIDDVTGLLSPLAPATYSSGIEPDNILVSATGDAIVMFGTGGDVERADIDNGGTLVYSDDLMIDPNPFVSVGTSDGNYVYIGDQSSGALEILDLSGGDLVSVDTLNLSEGLWALALDDNDSNLYVFDIDENAYQYTVGNDGSLTEVSPASGVGGVTSNPFNAVYVKVPQ